LLSLTTLQHKKTEKGVGSLRRMGRKHTRMLSKSKEGSKGSLKAGPKGNHCHRIAHEFWTSYFGCDTPKNRAKAVKWLGKWKDLKVCGIPDSGADICTLAGNAWIIGKAFLGFSVERFYTRLHLPLFSDNAHATEKIKPVEIFNEGHFSCLFILYLIL